MVNEDKPSSAATGVIGLDDVLRGGFPRDRLLLVEGDPGVGKTTLALQFRGTSVLMLGPPGTGKSAVTTQWAASAAGRGQKTIIYAFDESVATIHARSRSLGIDLPAYQETGHIVVRQVDPAEFLPDSSPSRFATPSRSTAGG